MGLGLSKSFIIAFLLCALIAYGTQNVYNFFAFMGAYGLVVIVWRFLTR